MSGTGKPGPAAGGGKFENKNLNFMVKAPLKVNGAASRGAFHVMAGDKGKVGKSVGSAAAPVSAPVPMNTPSLRRENGGKDVSINLVPTATSGASAVWGSGAAEANKALDGYQAVAGVPAPAPAPSSSASAFMSRPAPWVRASPDDASGTSSAGMGAPPTTSAAKKSWAEVDSDDENENQRSSARASGSATGRPGPGLGSGPGPGLGPGPGGWDGGDTFNVLDSIRARATSRGDYSGVDGRYGRPDDVSAPIFRPFSLCLSWSLTVAVAVSPPSLSLTHTLSLPLALSLPLSLSPPSPSLPHWHVCLP